MFWHARNISKNILNMKTQRNWIIICHGESGLQTSRVKEGRARKYYWAFTRSHCCKWENPNHTYSYEVMKPFISCQDKYCGTTSLHQLKITPWLSARSIQEMVHLQLASRARALNHGNKVAALYRAMAKWVSFVLTSFKVPPPIMWLWTLTSLDPNKFIDISGKSQGFLQSMILIYLLWRQERRLGVTFGGTRTWKMRESLKCWWRKDTWSWKRRCFSGSNDRT